MGGVRIANRSGACLTSLALLGSLVFGGSALAGSPALAQVASQASMGTDYMAFLSASRTPFEVARQSASLMEGAGFVKVDPTDPKGLGEMRPGARIYAVNRGRTIFFVIVGERPVEEGVKMIMAHADVPSLRLLSDPVDGGRLRARHYGGIKAYHYRGIPLELRGRAITADGSTVDVVLGEKEGFVFTAHDLSTAERHSDKRNAVSSAHTVLVASRPSREPRGGASVKQSFLSEIYRRFGMTELDLERAEIYAIPAWAPRDVGLDRAAIGGFGHDDRACSFAALRAMLDGGEGAVPEYTSIVALVDREEIGSTGVTGARSAYMRTLIGALLESQGPYSEQRLRRTLAASRVISSDVTSAINPLFESVSEPMNAPTFGHGPAFMKFTGVRGKSGGSDANAEFVREIFDTFRAAGAPLQVSEIGRVDEGGGGTIAKYIAHQGAQVLDVGVALLSMHSPFELVHKADLVGLTRGFAAFFWGVER